MSKMGYFLAGAALMGVAFVFLTMEPDRCYCLDDMKDMYKDTKRDVQNCIKDVKHDIEKHM